MSESTDNKKTQFYDYHVAAGGKMVPFAGYLMPVQYPLGIMQEHLHTRDNAGLFDVSHMGEFLVKGENALELIQKISSNDASLLFPGRAQYAYFPNNNGGVIDDMITYMIAENHYMLVVNASNIEKDWKWITKWNKQFKAKINNISNQISLLAIQGPKAIEVVQNLTESDLNSLPYYSHVTTSFAGKKDVLVATTGYTGSGGVEVYCKNEDAIEIWKLIFKAGQKFNIIPVGLAARDTLRTEMGYCLYGNEINEDQSPIEAGLGQVTRPQTNFINAVDLGKEKTEGTANCLVGFELQERGIPRTGHELFDLEGTLIGSVTSGTQAPSLRKGIGLGYVTKEFSAIGSKIQLQVRNKMLAATVVSSPFYKA